MQKNSKDDTKKTRSELHKNSRKKHKKIKPWQVIVVIILGLILAGVGYAARVLTSANNLLSRSYTPIEKKVEENRHIDPLKDPISILLLGVDNDDDRQLDSTRTDAMILMTFNPINKDISMVSIPRDTYTYMSIPNQFEGMTKINAAYSFGEAEAAIDAVEDLMELPINYYITVDFTAFEDIVNAVGGVEVDVPYDIKEQNAKGKFVIDLKEGRQHLNGEEALAFARTRKGDNDILRGSRQQEVMNEIMKKAMSIGSITKLENIMEAISGHFWTNMDKQTIFKVAEAALVGKESYDIQNYIFDWSGFNYYGEDMVGLNDDSLQYISHKLRLSLGLDEPDERDEEGYEFQTNGLTSPKNIPNDGMAVWEE